MTRKQGQDGTRQPRDGPPPGRRFEVDEVTPLPAIHSIPGVGRASSPVGSRIETIYFDTAAHALAARHIILRRRSGGTEPGWKLRFCGGASGRQDITAPLGQPEVVPRELLTQVLVYTRGEKIVPVAHLKTERGTRRLYGPAGEHLADFVDNLVTTQVMHPDGAAVRWREWEVLPVHGTGDLLVAAEELLIDSGARISSGLSELHRARGGEYLSCQLPTTPMARKKGPALDVVTSYLEVHIAELCAHDPDVRNAQAGAVHGMRTSTRRLRSALSIYSGLFKAGTAAEIGDELKWLAGHLGRVRDTEVLDKRLRRRVRELPASPGSCSVWGPIEQELGTARNTDRRSLLKALESTRYQQLLESLERFRDHPPTNSKAYRPARQETAKWVNRSAKLMARAQKSAAGTRPGADRDIALHRVRKDAKRLLNAADSVANIFPRGSGRIKRQAFRLQQILGDHQDSVMVIAFLDELAGNPLLSGETRRAYQQIQDVERGIAEASARKYSKARKKYKAIRLPR